MKTYLLMLSVLLINISITTVIAQNPGDLDPYFNGTGIFTKDFYGNSDIINDIAVQSDEKIVSVGVAFTPEFNIDVKIIRVLPNGAIDTDFGTNGVVSYNSGATGYYETHANAVYIKDDGKILVAGGQLNTAFIFEMLLIQLNPDGSFDPDFGTNGVSVVPVSEFGSFAQDVTVNSDGQILVAGTVTNADFNDTPAVVRFNNNGSPDATFGSNGVAQLPVVATDNEFSSICLQPDQKILASGHLSVESEPGVWYMVALVTRFLPNGALDESFGANGIVTHNLNGADDEFFGMDLTGNRDIVCGGFTNAPDGFDMFLMKFDSLGSPISDFGYNGVDTLHRAAYNVIYDLKIQSDDKSLVCGSIGEFAPGNNDFALVRFLENGSPDNSFGTNGLVLTDFFGEQDEAQSLAIAGNNRIYLGGKSLNSSTTIRDFTLACYVNNLHTSIRPAAGFQTASISPNPVDGHAVVTGCKGAVVSLTNMQGSSIRSWNINSDSCDISFLGINAGVYMASISTGTGLYYEKILVQ
jgi:uncharacterized delta-60 repeat protein